MFKYIISGNIKEEVEKRVNEAIRKGDVILGRNDYQTEAKNYVKRMQKRSGPHEYESYGGHRMYQVVMGRMQDVNKVRKERKFF